MDKVKGIVLVALGASCYGLLATLIQIAYNEGAHTALLSFTQYLFGVILLSGLTYIRRKKRKPIPEEEKKSVRRDKIKLLFFGIPMGLTNCFYYLSVKYVPISVAVILLMQSIWMGVVWELIAQKGGDKKYKIIGSILVLGGTLLAVNVFGNAQTLDWRGVMFGLLSALSYTISINATNEVGMRLPNLLRSQYLVIGAFITIILYWNFTIIQEFDSTIFIKYGLILSIFGTFLPILFFTEGFPKIGLGLGSIISSIEIPVAILSAHFILSESIVPVQWLGMFIMMVAIVFINLKQVIHRFNNHRRKKRVIKR